MARSLFRIEMLPARQGDALWVEYGSEDSPRRILIDGGPIKAWDALEKKCRTLPENDKGFELIVNTHIDADHIEGIIRLLGDQRKNWLISPKDIWFNGWAHLDRSNMLGGREGDFLSAVINRRAYNKWNRAFKGKAVVVDPAGPLPVKTLEDGMKITLLSPEPDKLVEMADKWAADVKKFELDPGDLDEAWKQFVGIQKYRSTSGMLGDSEDVGRKLKKQLKTDQSVSNGTSIAFLAEFEGKSCLFLGDAHKDVICRSLKKLIPPGQQRLKVDAVKMSHHGSRSNISKEMMDLLDARHFLVSTNGATHKHPNKSAIQAVIHWSPQPPEIWFNYCSKPNSVWRQVAGQAGQNVTPHYPAPSDEGITIDL